VELLFLSYFRLSENTRFHNFQPSQSVITLPAPQSVAAAQMSPTLRNLIRYYKRNRNKSLLTFTKNSIFKYQNQYIFDVILLKFFQ